jgi:DNA-binding NarL/FixJ family response regulator
MLAEVERRGAAKGRVRVALVVDEPVRASALAQVLEGEADVELLGVASNPQEALALAAGARPQVLVVDRRLQGAGGLQVGGLEVAAQVRERLPEIRVLSIGGGAELLPGSPDAEDLLEALRRAGGLDRPVSLLDVLTARELELLPLLAEGLDNRAIACRLGIGYVTVRTHLRNLSSKLDAHSRCQVVARAAELGLIER